MNAPRKTRMKAAYILGCAAALLALAACTRHPSLPKDFEQEDRAASIFPDYTDVTVPANIAPLNFGVLEGTGECVASITAPDGTSLTYGEGNKVQIPEGEWAELIRAARGRSLAVRVFAKKGGAWTAFRPFAIHVAEEPIDPYISYRVISPSYVAYEMLSINQRDLTSFGEKEIYNNMIVSSEDNGQCINCHSYQNYGTANMQFHMRQGHGGTMIVRDGRPYKVDLKTDSTLSAGVYPAWHPTLPLIAYSANTTGQTFHTKDKAKIEVQDMESELILYDVERNEVSVVENDSAEFEVFPWWSPDGKSLYYCSAHFEVSDTSVRSAQVIERYRDFKYNIYRRAFDARTKTFGARELVYDAAAAGKSATLPRISPDGRYLLFGQGEFGVFHVWHPDADLYLTDLRTRQTRKLENVNSSAAESYHSWSSNGRWIAFISRRDDGNFSRLYFAYFDKQGRAHKPFELPQKDPDFYTYYLRSYNVPEFMKEPVSVTPQAFASTAKTKAVKAKFVSR